MSNNKAFKVKNGLELAGYDTSKAATAVDVFVYDTSKDSDGGAWRKRTQGTSWYNETLNTATRGSRKEFPSVAVIVAEASTVTIYDGDDPSLPMWMVFEKGGVHPSVYMLGRSAPDNTAVASLNGVLAVSIDADTHGEALSVINFVSDSAVMHSQANSWVSGQDISGRNNSVLLTIDSSVGNIVDRVANDVAMTVLPDSPIDPATGLPVPTVAVATRGGVSVITDSGAVYDITNVNASYTNVLHVDFDSLNNLWLNQGNTSLSYNSWVYVFAMPLSADTVITLNSQNATGANPIAMFQRTVSNGASIPFNVQGGDSLIAESSLATSGGLGILSVDYADSTKSMGAEITSTYNTGWQQGDIKGAFLSDTDDTDLVDTEFVTLKTPDVACIPNGITLSGSTITVSAEVGVSFSSSITEPFVGLREKTSYVLTFTKTTGAGGGSQSAWIAVGFGLNAVGSCSFSSHYGGMTLGHLPAGDYSLPFTTGTRIGDVGLFMRSVNTTADFTHSFNNISVRLADADRSVNANPLEINGTVTRTPVATGADLVAYSGFSASNYLEQPYNSDLDFGTGDFCVMGWVKMPSSNQNLLMRDIDGVLSSDDTAIIRATGVGTIKYYGRVSGSFFVIESLAGSATGQWAFFCVRKDSGNIRVSINANSEVSQSRSQAFGPVNSILRVGARTDVSSSAPFLQGSAALLRISATAPTAEQIAKIYNDEKVLFQENAQATLYGTSDSVTALAHDSDTDLLHVGTSDGRSVFQGLRRVSNTTTAVGTAISASNGLVVEE